jgi:hypothetical protein
MNVSLPSLLLPLIAVGTGCADRPREDRVSREELAAVWRAAPPAAAAPAVRPMPVKEGEPPLAYWMESGAVVRVTDVGQNLDVAQGFVPARSIVRVDGKRGVIFGTETLYPGPLPLGSRYVISVEPDPENVARQETVQVRPRRGR